MLVIRREQMEILSACMLKGFEDRIVGYLAKRFPDACAAKDEPAPRESLRKGIEHASRHGITTEYDVARYIELMYCLSEDFETSPETFWVSAILENPELSPSEKMDQLYAQADRELHHLSPNILAER